MNKIPSALIAAALHVAPKNDVRFYLNGVLIESHADGAIIVATDGHRMLVVRTSLPWDLGKIIVPRDACELIAKMKGDVDFSAVGDAKRFKADRGCQAIEFAAIDGTYPDWRAVVSKPNELKPSGFDPSVLEGVVKAAGVLRKAFGGKATSLIPVTGGDVTAMFAVGGITDAYIRSAAFVVMPMRDSAYPEALCSDALRA
ncbi:MULTISPECIES: hypothetical protein [Stenotrophomonas maltophilia group]|uniref:DNA polymerase III subunit beta family protein n=1 Tax=Stenotrophomonas maltophilia group TaxID=995085 RepID=UPI000DA773B4|nr:MULTISPECIES: hypothetical protein [Stenotrophomonas maltophilia group]MCU1089725.1 hypothetical protein [Stenotrophomonas maltophilia]MCZ7843170.1 hypothetical protein [Stenotrophomonas maltophilia]PZT41222.1 hypothetical protein A7X97_03785 [Stenotrophomonas sepilia]